MIQNHKTCSLHHQISLEIRGERGMEIAPFCDFVVGVFFTPEQENLLPMSGNNTFKEWSFKSSMQEQQICGVSHRRCLCLAPWHARGPLPVLPKCSRRIFPSTALS